MGAVTEKLDLKQRVHILEEQVEILRRALGMTVVGGKPAVEWADAQMQRAREGEFRYTPVEPGESE